MKKPVVINDSAHARQFANHQAQFSARTAIALHKKMPSLDAIRQQGLIVWEQNRGPIPFLKKGKDVCYFSRMQSTNMGTGKSKVLTDMAVCVDHFDKKGHWLAKHTTPIRISGHAIERFVYRVGVANSELQLINEFRDFAHAYTTQQIDALGRTLVTPNGVAFIADEYDSMTYMSYKFPDWARDSDEVNGTDMTFVGQVSCEGPPVQHTMRNSCGQVVCNIPVNELDADTIDQLRAVGWTMPIVISSYIADKATRYEKLWFLERVEEARRTGQMFMPARSKS